MRNRLTTDTEYWQLKDEYEALKEADKASQDKEKKKQTKKLRRTVLTKKYGNRQMRSERF